MKPGDQVESIYTREQGTVTRQTVPGYSWVRWNDGREFPVSNDSIDCITPQASPLSRKPRRPA